MELRAKIVGCLLLIAITVIFTVCLGVNAASMQHCSAMNNNGVICSMDMSDIGFVWHQAVIDLQDKFGFIGLLSLSFFFAYGLNKFPLVARQRLYSKKYDYLWSLSYLFQLFTRGILRSKVY